MPTKWPTVAPILLIIGLLLLDPPKYAVPAVVRGFDGQNISFQKPRTKEVLVLLYYARTPGMKGDHLVNSTRDFSLLQSEL